MQFWSKGLGKKTISLLLSKGESQTSGDALYLIGRMEAPVDWDYIMPLRDDDIVDFFDLLRDPAIAQYIHSSPQRWQIYGAMLVRGLLLAGKVLAQVLRSALGRGGATSEIAIEVPPPSAYKKKKKKSKAADESGEAKKKPRRRRLSNRTTSAPSLSSGMVATRSAFSGTDEEAVDEAIHDAMQAAPALE